MFSTVLLGYKHVMREVNIQFKFQHFAIFNEDP